MQENNVIVDKCLEFGVLIVRYCESLDRKRKFVVSQQLLRCGTSIGANVFEAQQAESRADFVHKMKIAIKEANETTYWLYLCEKSEDYPEGGLLKSKVEELIRILSKIIISSKNK